MRIPDSSDHYSEFLSHEDLTASLLNARDSLYMVLGLLKSHQDIGCCRSLIHSVFRYLGHSTTLTSQEKVEARAFLDRTAQFVSPYLREFEHGIQHTSPASLFIDLVRANLFQTLTKDNQNDPLSLTSPKEVSVVYGQALPFKHIPSQHKN